MRFSPLDSEKMQCKNLYRQVGSTIRRCTAEEMEYLEHQKRDHEVAGSTPGSAVSLPRNSDSRQVVHTHAHLLRSTISWYGPKEGAHVWHAFSRDLAVSPAHRVHPLTE